MKQHMERYTPEQQQIIHDYWEVIRWTRQTGKVSDGIKKTELEYWSQYDADVVVQALAIHIDKHANIREHYTRGIMRNLAAEKSAGVAKKYSAAGSNASPAPVKKNRFVNFDQRGNVDYEALQYLEKILPCMVVL